MYTANIILIITKYNIILIITKYNIILIITKYNTILIITKYNIVLIRKNVIFRCAQTNITLFIKRILFIYRNDLNYSIFC